MATKPKVACCLASAISLSFEHTLFRFDRSKFLGGSSSMFCFFSQRQRNSRKAHTGPNGLAWRACYHAYMFLSNAFRFVLIGPSFLEFVVVSSRCRLLVHVPRAWQPLSRYYTIGPAAWQPLSCYYSTGTMPPALDLAGKQQKTVRAYTTDQKLWLMEVRAKSPSFKQLGLVQEC